MASVSVLAVGLSIMSYRSAVLTSDEIVKIAASDVKENAETQAYDLSRIISSKVRSINENLQILANGPEVQKGDFQSPLPLFTAAQGSTFDLTDYYMLINTDGKIVLSSNMIRAAYEHPEADQSAKPIFTEPMRTRAVYYSNLTATPGNAQKMYVSYPILYSLNDDSGQFGEFKGVVAASINLETLGTLLQKELVPGLNTEGLALLGSDGAIIYATEKSLIGENAFAAKDQSILSSAGSRDDIEAVNKVIKDSLDAGAGSHEVTMNKQTYTLAHRPIIYEGQKLWTLLVWTPHDFASSVDSLVEKQNNFGILLIVTIGVITIGTAYLVLTWNGRLSKTVDLRTNQLRNLNTRLEQSNAGLSRANEQLKIHSKMQEEFVNVAAHELRTPTMPIVALTEMLESIFKNKQEIVLERGDFDILLRNARRLERLSTDILDTTRIESHSLPLKKEVFDMDDIISVAVEDARHQVANGGANVDILYEPTRINIKADKTRIGQVISNIMNNAVKFTREGTIRVSAHINSDGTNAVVSIKDTGTGIDPEILPRLFAKFSTKSHVNGPQRGTGLGLFIAKSIIEAHGGRIWAENNDSNNSEGERGSTFSFSLPIHGNSAVENRISEELDATKRR
ncbi:MAG TPA: sensor histidine kinase [Nitrososphaera sp.]|nr:sensor histidine kinase [Nitrososphaera sp.]